MNGTPRQDPSPARALAQLLQGNQVQQAVYVAARLGIADLLAGGPRDCAELASAAGAHPDALRRLLRALAGFGVFAEDDAGRFSLTALGAALRRGPRSALPFALWSGGVSYRAFGGLEHSVRTGEPAFEALYGTEFFAYLAEHPEDGETFDEMMARHTAPVAGAVAELDLAATGTVVDVGGGRGDLLAAVLRRHPGLRGVLLERPRLLDRAHEALAAAGVVDRCAIVPGDALRAVPPGDTYLLKSVLHGLDDRAATRVLANCRRAMPAGGRVLVVELVLPGPNAASPARLMDLLMLVGCHGRERTEAEFRDLLDAAGLRLAGATPVRGGYQMLDARARDGARTGPVRIEVNGAAHRVAGDPARSLLRVLREDLALTGAKPGCGEGACGACTVLVDDLPVRACVTPVGTVAGRRVTTVEGLSGDGRPHPVQEALLRADALQCGYCGPGMVMTAVGLLAADPAPDRRRALAALQGNVCRCGAYPRILSAVVEAAGTAAGTGGGRSGG